MTLSIFDKVLYIFSDTYQLCKDEITFHKLYTYLFFNEYHLYLDATLEVYCTKNKTIFIFEYLVHLHSTWIV